VRQKAPPRSVPLRREEIAPILPDQPGAENARQFGTTREFPEFSEPANNEDCEHGEAERELVDPQPAQVDARTESVPF
jgi:hypothetical protein